MGDQQRTSETNRAVQRSAGVTATERLLARLEERAFLRLWSYPNVYRDQGQAGRSREGKEVCDLLVVCGDEVVIFSDIDCQFPEHGDIPTRWSSWYKRAVLKSADQVWRAERWLREHPDRLFLDRRCERPLPIRLPSPAGARCHGVVVAHGASARCRAAFGGNGTLMLTPRIVGSMHYHGDEVMPFAIGRVDPSRGHVHVFDDVAIDFVLDTLDTVTGFTRYLTKRERLITSDRLIGAAGEEDLLA